MSKILQVNVDDIGMGGVFALVRNIVRLRPPGAVVDIAAIEPFERSANVELLRNCGCTVHYVGRGGSKVLKNVAAFLNLRKLLATRQYDAVHIHADVANKLLVSACAAKLAGCRRVIVHSHASGVDGGNRRLKKMLHLACRRLLRYVATDYLSCSDLATEWMFPNVGRQRVVLIRNGVNLERFRYSQAVRAKLREELGIDGKLVVGHVGRFAYQKNHDYLVDIFNALHSERPDAVLLLVGEGPLEKEVRTKVDASGLGESVIFCGVRPNISDLMQAMDVFVLPSHFEGLPIVGVEAQAAALPCVFSDKISRKAKICADVDFLPIEDSTVASWVASIERLASNRREDSYDTMRRAGFSIENTVSSLWRVYEKQLER